MRRISTKVLSQNPPEGWPPRVRRYEQIGPMRRSDLAPIFREPSVAYGDSRYERAASQFPGIESGRFHMLYPPVANAMQDALESRTSGTHS